MTKKRLAVPDSIFCSASSEDCNTRRTPKKKKRKRAATGESKKRSSSRESSDEELVERRLLRKEQQLNSELRRKVRKLQEKLEVLEQRNGKLQDLLCNKLETWFSQPAHRRSAAVEPFLQENEGTSGIHDETESHCQDAQLAHERLADQSVPPGEPQANLLPKPHEPVQIPVPLQIPVPVQIPVPTQIPVPQQPLPPQPNLLAKPHEALPVQIPVPQQPMPPQPNLLPQQPDMVCDAVRAEDTNQDADAMATLPPLLALVNSEVHLGKGVFVKEEQWSWLLSRPKDSLFCKEATKLLWGIPNLRNRSLTGAPCRRFLKQENLAPPRKALTPEKLQAVANGFAAYVSKKASETPKADRLRKMNRFIAEMLNDLKK
ncbi:protein enabled homolog [Dermacentor silvarum]|uniref:protein enabled homolog n=1 Tax=Dermacentor silvarum TaxID=543639 RepID=UPI0021009D7E|nr:protein enabled homolog [Dermacentor silvarum]